MAKNIFTFRPINYSHWNENNDKSWVLNPSSDWKEKEKQYEKYSSFKNKRGYKIFKIEPVKKEGKNYTLVAFPLFPSLSCWNVADSNFYAKHFATESIEIFKNKQGIHQERTSIEDFLWEWDGKGGLIRADEVPFFSVISASPFLTKTVEELDYAKIKFLDPIYSEVGGNLTEEMVESDLCLIVPPSEDYKITRIVEQEQGNGEGNNQYICQLQNETRQFITRLLASKNLKTLDLPAAFQSWETDLAELDEIEKIETWRKNLEQVILGQQKQPNPEINPEVNQADNDFLWPLLIGGGIVIVIIAGLAIFPWLKTQKN